eukprot:CAMPEP_0113524496 /NCGR_PEP_ID=MMETSP0014_2-20120614/46247_1 /TAXON_ID=2857 /ORGANISM="Nitzschia sp." /LENGTH=1530 /DNA_ID=CAMNT_0000422611 /DNA_START=90 /DNA_END=4685 /DNA_ORIENTATION=- /assembly_acc=CAM_ASM_000159
MCRGDSGSSGEEMDRKDEEVMAEAATAEEAAIEIEAETAMKVMSAAAAEEENDESKVVPTEIQRYPWWRGGGVKPNTGKDMGVFDASLEDRASCVGLWSMNYLNPLLSLGSRKVLDFNDVGVPSNQDRAERAYLSAKQAWEDRSVQATKDNEHYMKTKYVPALQKLDRQLEEEVAKMTASGDETSDEQKKKIASEKQQKQRLELEQRKTKAWKEPSISSSLVVSFGGWKLGLAIFAQVIAALLSFVPVLILNDLVSYFEWTDAGLDQDEYEFAYVQNPWVAVVGLGLVPCLVSLLQTRSNAVMAHCGVFVRTAVSTMLYRKALNVSAAGRAKTSTGQVVNMMSNDTMQLQRFLQFASFTIVAPLQIVIALVLIYGQVGNAMWVGVAYMLFLLPINAKVFSVVANMRRKVLKYSDMRVKMMNEILTGIRIIKFYAWERPFGKEVSRVRQLEMDALTKLAYTVAVGFSIILLSTPIVQPIIVFVTYVNVQDQPLTAATAFTTVALFNLMRFPFAFMPMGLLQYIQSKISLKRLERYLTLPELNPYVVDTPPPDTPEDSPFVKSGSITIQDGSFSWIDPDGPEIRPVQDEEKSKKKKRAEKKERRKSRRKSTATQATDEEEGNNKEGDSAMSASIHSNMSSAGMSTVSEESGATNGSGPKGSVITLQNISCQIEPGHLVAVVGAVGSGKSSLLSAILGEMESINNSKVYVPRHGEEEKAMNGFASYCTQSPWVVNDTLRGNILFGRDYDEERYNKVLDVCALDDDIAVLPAGDKTEIGERGINLSGGQKARVSLARAMYSEDPRLLLLDDPDHQVASPWVVNDTLRGNILFGRDYDEERYNKVLDVCALDDDIAVLPAGDKTEIGERGINLSGGQKARVSLARAMYSEDPRLLLLDDPDHQVASPWVVNDTLRGNILFGRDYDEERYNKVLDVCALDDDIAVLPAGDKTEIGERGINLSGGKKAGRTFEIMSTFWLSKWAADMQAAEARGEPFSVGETNFYVAIYALFGLLGIFGLGFRGIFIAIHRLKASQQLHDGLTDSVLSAPVSFFDVTPIGRILNRFAADMDKVDLELTQTISQGTTTIFNVLGALGAIAAATKGTFVVLLIPLGCMYYLVQKWFRKSSTELQRVTSVSNSPIFADFSQTLSGTSTIRAYGVQTGFFNQCKNSFDNMNASYILVQLCSYWLALRLDVMGGLIAMFVGAVAVGTLPYGFIPAGFLGLALTFSIEVTSYLKFGVQMIARLEADMSSVERILYYTDKIEPEAPPDVPDKDPPEGTWPTSGQIEFNSASMRYRDGPLVLKELTLTVNAGEKIGVCGRTGSGKSSLMIALFRISEIEKDGGSIVIDGVNTGEIGTAALRLNLSIIPQDPVMFSNTVRYNLDPFASASDEELWDVLKKVKMGEAIATLPKGLDEEVAEGGENFSQGQRQLLCIARSLLRHPKILVMDEATASIDNETDAAIQQMIRENFGGATVLTIAHRLNTIMDSDRILVLDDGRIAELDTPENLLSKEDGLFKAMVDKSRAAHSQTLDEDM